MEAQTPWHGRLVNCEFLKAVTVGSVCVRILISSMSDKLYVNAVQAAQGCYYLQIMRTMMLAMMKAV